MRELSLAPIQALHVTSNKWGEPEPAPHTRGDVWLYVRTPRAASLAAHAQHFVEPNNIHIGYTTTKLLFTLLSKYEFRNERYSRYFVVATTGSSVREKDPNKTTADCRQSETAEQREEQL